MEHRICLCRSQHPQHFVRRRKGPAIHLIGKPRRICSMVSGLLPGATSPNPNWTAVASTLVSSRMETGCAVPMTVPESACRRSTKAGGYPEPQAMGACCSRSRANAAAASTQPQLRSGVTSLCGSCGTPCGKAPETLTSSPLTKNWIVGHYKTMWLRSMKTSSRSVQHNGVVAKRLSVSTPRRGISHGLSRTDRAAVLRSPPRCGGRCRGLPARSQDVDDGMATIGYGYTFNRHNNAKRRDQSDRRTAARTAGIAGTWAR